MWTWRWIARWLWSACIQAACVLYGRKQLLQLKVDGNEVVNILIGPQNSQERSRLIFCLISGTCCSGLKRFYRASTSWQMPFAWSWRSKRLADLQSPTPLVSHIIKTVNNDLLIMVCATFLAIFKSFGPIMRNTCIRKVVKLRVLCTI